MKIEAEINLHTPMPQFPCNKKQHPQRPESCSAQIRPPKIPFRWGLRYAAQFLPYGVRDMMQFAWLSQDFRAKKVGSWWLFADKAIQDSADLEALCEKAGITPAEFIGVIAGVAFELRVDVSPLIGGISDTPRAVDAALAHAIHTGEGLEGALAATENMGKEIQRCSRYNRRGAKP
jgi:hypothetical protein